MDSRNATFDTPGHVVLSLRVPTGEISIETHDGTETYVELRAGGGEEAAREALERSRIDLRERGEGRWEVVVEVPKRRGFGLFFGEPTNELRVRAPHGCAVSVETRSADVEGRGRYGQVEIQSVSGDVRFDEINEASTIRTTSGDVRVDLGGAEIDVNTTSGDVDLGAIHGRVNVRAVSGDVRIRHAAESVQVTSVSGDQDLEGVVAGDVRLQSVSGDVRVGIRRGSRLWVDAKSLSGDTTSELDLGDAPDGEEEGAPLVELRANTVSGDIRVVRAGAPVH
jgi:hypothetical protein